MSKRRKFSEEFKREAVQLSYQPGVTQKQIGEELGINANMIGRWRRDMQQSRSHDSFQWRQISRTLRCGGFLKT
jgi:transposase